MDLKFRDGRIFFSFFCCCVLLPPAASCWLWEEEEGGRLRRWNPLDCHIKAEACGGGVDMIEADRAFLETSRSRRRCCSRVRRGGEKGLEVEVQKNLCAFIFTLPFLLWTGLCKKKKESSCSFLIFVNAEALNVFVEEHLGRCRHDNHLHYLSKQLKWSLFPNQYLFPDRLKGGGAMAGHSWSHRRTFTLQTASLTAAILALKATGVEIIIFSLSYVSVVCLGLVAIIYPSFI